MARIPWKQDKVISMNSGAGFYYLVQMLEEPYLAIFNIYRSTEDWNDVNLSNENLLFAKAVTRQFISASDAKTVKIPHAQNIEVPRLWIAGYKFGSRIATLFPGTKHEIKMITMEPHPGGQLIEKILHPEYQIRVVQDISLNDNKIIDSYELNDVDIFPNLNERIVLCQQLKKNVDPFKDIMFDCPLPLSYLDFVKKCIIPFEG